MFKLFQSYSPFSAIALLLATLVLKLFWLIHPEPAAVFEHQQAWQFLLAGIQFVLGEGALTMTFFAVANLAGQALYCNHIAANTGLFSNRNYLPAFCYILFTSLLPEWNYLSAALISNWLLLFSLNGMLQLHNTTTPRKLLFNTGFAVTLACILSTAYLPLLLLFAVAISISRPFRISEWVIALLGVLLPVYFIVSILFLANHLYQIKDILPNEIGIVPYFPWAPETVKPYTVLFSLVLILVVGLVSLNKYSEHMLTLVKKRWNIIIAGFFITLVPLFISGLGGISMALPALTLLSLIAANALIRRQKKTQSRILLYLFLAVLIFAEWIPLS